MRAAGKYAKNGGEFGGIAEIEIIKTFESIIFYSVSREILATRLCAPTPLTPIQKRWEGRAAKAGGVGTLGVKKVIKVYTD